jgi:hypothetical protein
MEKEGSQIWGKLNMRKKGQFQTRDCTEEMNEKLGEISGSFINVTSRH